MKSPTLMRSLGLSYRNHELPALEGATSKGLLMSNCNIHTMHTFPIHAIVDLAGSSNNRQPSRTV